MSTTSPIQPAADIDLTSILQRVAALECEVAKLKSHNSEGSRWLENIKGSMKDDPEFAEVLRLGQEFRKNYFTE